MRTTITKPVSSEEITAVKITHYFNGANPLTPTVVVMDDGVPHQVQIDMTDTWQGATAQQRNIIKAWYNQMLVAALNKQVEQYSVTVATEDLEGEYMLDPVVEEPVV